MRKLVASLVLVAFVAALIGSYGCTKGPEKPEAVPGAKVEQKAPTPPPPPPLPPPPPPPAPEEKEGGE